MKTKLLAIAIALFAFSATQAQVTPPGLNPGDQFRYAFVTSTETPATSTNIADFELGSGNLVRLGFSNSTSGAWVFDTVGVGGVPNNFYGLSEVLTVAAVPEPSTTLFYILSSFALVGGRRR